MKNGTKGLIYLIVCLAVLGIIAAIVLMTSSAQRLTYQEFLDLAKNGEIESVYIMEGDLYANKKDSKSNVEKGGDYIVNIPSRVSATETLHEINEILKSNKGFEIDISYNNPYEGSIWSAIVPILGLLVLVAIGFYAIRAMISPNKQAMNFGKSKARVNEAVKVRFNDVAGAEEEKEELCEIVEFLKNPHKFSMVGARIPKGVLLIGQPGTGKTLFAKAIAGEANVPFFSISGSDFVEMYVGVGASRVRDLFSQAKANKPCIVFIDEIDAVGRQRGTGLGGGHDEREQTLNQLLVQMDGFEPNEGVIIIAATNRADVLDPALMRPGRFDRQIYVHIPDVRGREAILKVHSRNKPLAPDIDFRVLARMTSGFTGADIENLLNEAAILCARDNRKLVSMNDINEGINKVILGPQKKSRLVTEYDKRVTAFHEAGHAVVAKSLKYCDPVHEVSIIPRGGAAGYTMMRPDNDDMHTNKNKLLDDIALSMGGRVAEEIFIEEISTGAEGDIKQATQRARKMVTEWGMSDLGPVYMGGGHNEVFLGRSISTETAYSESVTAKIDAAISQIVNDGYKRAQQILTEKKDIVEKMARILVERETIYTDEVDLLMEGKSLEEVLAFIDEKNKNKKVPYTNTEVSH